MLKSLAVTFQCFLVALDVRNSAFVFQAKFKAEAVIAVAVMDWFQHLQPLAKYDDIIVETNPPFVKFLPVIRIGQQIAIKLCDIGIVDITVANLFDFALDLCKTIV